MDISLLPALGSLLNNPFISFIEFHQRAVFTTWTHKLAIVSFNLSIRKDVELKISVSSGILLRLGTNVPSGHCDRYGEQLPHSDDPL